MSPRMRRLRTRCHLAVDLLLLLEKTQHFANTLLQSTGLFISWCGR